MYGDSCFGRKNVYNCAIYVFSAMTLMQKTVHGVETHKLSGKETFPVAMVNKEGHADSFSLHERTHTNFLEKGVTVKSASYC